MHVFCLSVSLRVECSQMDTLCAKKFPKSVPEIGGEVCVSIRDNFGRNPIVVHNMMEEEGCYFFC